MELSNISDASSAPQTETALQYCYQPSLPSAAFFVSLFGLSLSGYLFQIFARRKLTASIFATGALFETLGWAAKLWQSKSTYSQAAFLSQNVALLTGPSFLSAGIYLTLGDFIEQLGSRASVISRAGYMIVFIPQEAIATIAQVLGTLLSSGALLKFTDTKFGPRIILAGIVVQSVADCLFILLFLDFLRRLNRHDTSVKSDNALICAIAVSMAAVVLRNLSRIISLALGSRIPFVTSEPLSISFDAVLMVIVLGIYNVIDLATALRSCTNAEIIEKEIRDGYLGFHSVSEKPTLSDPKAEDRKLSLNPGKLSYCATNIQAPHWHGNSRI